MQLIKYYVNICETPKMKHLFNQIIEIYQPEMSKMSMLMLH